MTTTKATVRVAFPFLLTLATTCIWGCGDTASPTAAVDRVEVDPEAGLQSTGQGGPQGRTPLIVILAEKTNPAAVAQEHGIQTKHLYRKVLKGFAGDMSEAARSGLLRDQRVVRVEKDQALGVAEGAQTSPPWGLDRIDQRGRDLDGSYSYASAGAGVTAYVVDTGIRFTHSDFGGRAVPGYDAFSEDGADCNGHGTHVAGILGGETYGVAKGVSLVSVRVLGCNGTGFTSGVIAGLEWIAENATGPSVANMSLIAGASSALDEAVANLVGQGVNVVVAAGNDDQDACSFSPSGASSALTVAASVWTDVRADFSNWGSCVDLFAPGVSIISASNAGDDAAEFRSGTSMASPHVSGAAALYLSQHPGAVPLEVTGALIESATHGAVSAANSPNNHLLFSLVDGSTPPNEEPPPNQPPTATFSAVCQGLVCTFSESSQDPDGSLSSWEWDFGDGTKAASSQPPPASGLEYAYAAGGEYTVTLTVTDDQGAWDAFSQVVTAHPPEPENSLPFADFSVACEDLLCTFSDLSSDVDGFLVQWEWQFGDGVREVVNDASVSAIQSHAFAEPGTYVVSLTVTDDGGASATGEHSVQVTSSPLEPTPAIELLVSGVKDKGRHVLELAWTGASGEFVEVWLDGAFLSVTENDGAYVHGTENKGKGAYRFKICEVDSDRCSTEVEFMF